MITIQETCDEAINSSLIIWVARFHEIHFINSVIGRICYTMLLATWQIVQLFYSTGTNICASSLLTQPFTAAFAKPCPESWASKGEDLVAWICILAPSATGASSRNLVPIFVIISELKRESFTQRVRMERRPSDNEGHAWLMSSSDRQRDVLRLLTMERERGRRNEKTWRKQRENSFGTGTHRIRRNISFRVLWMVWWNIPSRG